MSIFKISSIRNKLIQFNPHNHNRLFSWSALRCSKEYKTDEFDEDRPIVYSKTPAAKWKAAETRTGQADDSPWYEPYVILSSLTVFMIYFFFVREESDVDLQFNKNLYDQVRGLEEIQLESALQHSLDNNLNTDHIRARLEELRKQKT